ncbi:MAG TPA: RNHCP domain-containing protein [Cellulomonas sp.]
MPRAIEDTAFVCTRCGAHVPRHPDGSYRNHCRVCLCSRHVDERPGDRASACGGVMVPYGVDYSGKKGWVLLHRCEVCGHEGRNKTASDDDLDRILALQRETSGPPR